MGRDLTFSGCPEVLRGIFTGPKPGLKAQLKMSPRPRPGTRPIDEVRDGCSRAGVLVLLYPVEEELTLVLTRRTEEVEIHQRQISLPGGRQEEGETLRQAALREAREELGIPTDSLEILGELTPLYVPTSNYCIYPTVAYASDRPRFQPAPKEVAEVIEVSLACLIDPQSVREEVWNVRGSEVLVVYYAFGNYKIWGATAMVLAEFLEIVKMYFGRENGRE